MNLKLLDEEEKRSFNIRSFTETNINYFLVFVILKQSSDLSYLIYNKIGEQIGEAGISRADHQTFHHPPESH